MTESASPMARARMLMDAVAELHRRGHGRLKLFAYVKEGLGVWRHWLFASDAFPSSAAELPRPLAHGSLPGGAIANGSTASELADAIVTSFPDLVAAATGDDAEYVEWYRRMLEAEPDGVLEMESPRRATVGGRGIETPYRPDR